MLPRPPRWIGAPGQKRVNQPVIQPASPSAPASLVSRRALLSRSPPAGCLTLETIEDDLRMSGDEGVKDMPSPATPS